MKKIKLHFIILLVISFKTSFSQFNNTSVNMTASLSNINTDDNGNLIYSNFISSSNNLHIYKTDSLNNLIWKKEISFDQVSEYANIVKVNGNSIFIVKYYSPSTFFILTKLDANGNIMWSKKIKGLLSSIASSDINISKKKNIYISLGGCSYLNTFLKLDSLGNFIWSKQYVIPNGSVGYKGVVQKIISNGEDGLTMLSHFASTQSLKEIINLYKVDSSGNLILNRFYNIPDGESGNVFSNHLKRDVIGNYYFVENLETINRGAMIVKTDSLGNLIWMKNYHYPNAQVSVISQFDLDSENNIYTVGWGSPLNSFNGDTISELTMKINAVNGNVKNAWRGWNIIPNYPTIEAYDIKCTAKNRIVLGGFIQQTQGVIAAMDTSGIGLCGFYPTTISTSPYFLIDTVVSTVQYSQILSVTDTTFTENPSTTNPVPFCYSNGVDDRENTNSITIFPNPVSTQLTISLNAEQKNISIKIINVLGEVVIIPSPLQGGREGLIDISSLPQGIYFIEVTTADKQVMRSKVIKE